VTVEEFKALILWAKKERVRSINISNGDQTHAFELSDLAFLEHPLYVKEDLDSSKTLVDSAEDVSKQEEDESLFWSAGH